MSVLTYLLWFHLLNVSGATAASSYHFMIPPLGMLFGCILPGEHVVLADLAGIALVALDIYLVTRSPSWERVSPATSDFVVNRSRANEDSCDRMNSY